MSSFGMMYIKSTPLQRSTRIGILTGFIAAFGWAATGVFVHLLSDVPPFVILCGRFVIALILGVGLFVLYPKAIFELCAAMKSIFSWFLSLLSVMYYLFSVFAFQYTSVNVVSLLISISPIFVIIADSFFNKNFYILQKISVVSTLFGVTVIVIPSVFDANFTSVSCLGVTLAFGGAFVMAVYALLYRYLSVKGIAPNPIIVGLQANICGFLFSVLIVRYQFSEIFVEFSKLNTRNLILLLWLSLLSTVIPSVSYSVAAAKIAPILLTTIRSSTPVVAALLAFIVLGEVPKAEFYFGASFILGAVLLQMIDGLRIGRSPLDLECLENNQSSLPGNRAEVAARDGVNSLIVADRRTSVTADTTCPATIP